MPKASLLLCVAAVLVEKQLPLLSVWLACLLLCVCTCSEVFQALSCKNMLILGAASTRLEKCAVFL